MFSSKDWWICSNTISYFCLFILSTETITNKEKKYKAKLALRSCPDLPSKSLMDEQLSCGEWFLSPHFHFHQSSSWHGHTHTLCQFACHVLSESCQEVTFKTQSPIKYDTYPIDMIQLKAHPTNIISKLISLLTFFTPPSTIWFWFHSTLFTIWKEIQLKHQKHNTNSRNWTTQLQVQIIIWMRSNNTMNFINQTFVSTITTTNNFTTWSSFQSSMNKNNKSYQTCWECMNLILFFFISTATALFTLLKICPLLFVQILDLHLVLFSPFSLAIIIRIKLFESVFPSVSPSYQLTQIYLLLSFVIMVWKAIYRVCSCRYFHYIYLIKWNFLRWHWSSKEVCSYLDCQMN